MGTDHPEPPRGPAKPGEDLRLELSLGHMKQSGVLTLAEAEAIFARYYTTWYGVERGAERALAQAAVAAEKGDDEGAAVWRRIAGLIRTG